MEMELVQQRIEELERKLAASMEEVTLFDENYAFGKMKLQVLGCVIWLVR